MCIVDEKGNETNSIDSPNGNMIEVVDTIGGIVRCDDVMVIT